MKSSKKTPTKKAVNSKKGTQKRTVTVASAKKTVHKTQRVQGSKKKTSSTRAFEKASAMRVQRMETISKKAVSAKQVIYMGLAVLLGFLVGNLIHDFLEFAYLKQMLDAGVTPQMHETWGMPHFLPFSLVFGLIALGMLAGVWVGIKGWQMVYVEGRHWTKRRKK